jgi:hypothetical protein
MLARADVWRFLESTRAYPRWKLSGMHIELPPLRLTVDALRFSVSASLSLFDADGGDRPPVLVRSVNVAPVSRWLRRSTWYRNVFEQLGKPYFFDDRARGIREADFVRKVKKPTTQRLRDELALVTAAISPHDPRFDLLAALPLPFRLEGLSFSRRERRGRVLLAATVSDRGATFWAGHRQGKPLRSADTAWSRRAAATLARAGYRDPGDPLAMVYIKRSGGRRELARLDAVLDRALRDAKT